MSDRTRELECVISDLKQQARDTEKVRDDLLEALQQYGIGFTDEAAARAEFGNYEVDRELKRRAAIARATGEQP